MLRFFFFLLSLALVSPTAWAVVADGNLSAKPILPENLHGAANRAFEVFHFEGDDRMDLRALTHLITHSVRKMEGQDSSFLMWSSSPPILSETEETLRTPNGEVPSHQLKTMILSFEDPHFPIHAIQVERLTFLRKKAPEAFVQIIFDGLPGFKQSIFAYVSLEDFQIEGICLDEETCRYQMTSFYEDSTQKPPFDYSRSRKGWYTNSFDKAFEQHWKGKLSPICAILAGSGVDYNHPLIATHFDATPHHAPLLTPEQLKRRYSLEDFLLLFNEEGILRLSGSHMPITLGLDLLDGSNSPYGSDKKGKVLDIGTAVASVAFHGTQNTRIRSIRIPFDNDFDFSDSSDKRWTRYFQEISDYAQKAACPLVNMSFASSGDFSDTKIDAYKKLIAENEDKLFFLSAGIGYSDFFGIYSKDNDKSVPSFPAGIYAENSLSVGAWDQRVGRIGSKTPSDPELFDLLAPGEDIHVAKAGESNPTDAFHPLSGSAIASPWALNVAAKILQINPHLSSGDVKRILMDSLDENGVITPERAYTQVCQSQGTDPKGCLLAIADIPEHALGGPAKYVADDEQSLQMRMGGFQYPTYKSYVPNSEPVPYDIDPALSTQKMLGKKIQALSELKTLGIEIERISETHHRFLTNLSLLVEVGMPLLPRLKHLGLRKHAATHIIRIEFLRHAPETTAEISSSAILVTTDDNEVATKLLEFIIMTEELFRLVKSEELKGERKKRLTRELDSFPFFTSILDSYFFKETTLETAEIEAYHEKVHSISKEFDSELEEDRRAQKDTYREHLRAHRRMKRVLDSPHFAFHQDKYFSMGERDQIDIEIGFFQTAKRMKKLAKRQIAQTLSVRIHYSESITATPDGASIEIIADDGDNIADAMNFFISIEELRQISAAGIISPEEQVAILDQIKGLRFFEESGSQVSIDNEGGFRFKFSDKLPKPYFGSYRYSQLKVNAIIEGLTENPDFEEKFNEYRLGNTPVFSIESKS